LNPPKTPKKKAGGGRRSAKAVKSQNGGKEAKGKGHKRSKKKGRRWERETPEELAIDIKTARQRQAAHKKAQITVLFAVASD